MEAGKNIDCYGCFPGHSIEQADAEQAYVQADLTGTETWVAIPEEAWPDSWWNYPEGMDRSTREAKALRTPKYDRPCCRLLKSLYGHPDAGTMWEAHCHRCLLRQGFIPITSWPSCYFHSRLGLMLTVCVDDFKLAGPASKLKEGWDLISSQLEVEKTN